MIRDAEEFIRLRTSDTPDDYLRAATDEVPIEVWHEIIQRHPSMRKWVAQNKTVPIEILTILARDPNPDVRLSVAMKNKLPSELMLELADDDDEGVRQRIVHNKNASIAVLRKLSSNLLADIAEIARKRLESR
jgi:hypothetical protein